MLIKVAKFYARSEIKQEKSRYNNAAAL